MSLNKMKRFIDTQEFTSDLMWKDLFKEATSSCFQRSKRELLHTPRIIYIMLMNLSAYNKDVDEIREQLALLLNINPLSCDPSHMFFTTCSQVELLKVRRTFEE